MPNPFVPSDTQARYLIDRPAGVAHIRLDLALDFVARTLSGSAALTLRVRRDGLSAVTLSAVDMELHGITVDGAAVSLADVAYDGRSLRVPLHPPRPRGGTLELVVAYTARPTKGLYFLAPDETDPDRPEQCWTQGQDEDARHVFPCIDVPAEKATTELICLAPRDKVLLSNGDLLERADVEPNQTRWHYKLSSPQASYLVTLVCGPFAEMRDHAPETNVDLYYFLPPHRVADGQRALAKTPRMVDVFSKLIGIPYPHRRYSQVFVADFIFGGMENTTATTLTEQALLDERAALDHDVEPLVAHELAHQWWGDLVTCREWPEAWLNEGFATYFEYIWFEQDRGRDEADWHALEQLDHYLHEANEYQRSIVCRHYRDPIEIFDGHLYEKGGRVLHMLRHLVGDAAFFEALAAYGQRHAGGTVETRDLVRVFEEVTGRSLDRFFDQWVLRPGHPDLRVTWTWDDERTVGQLKVVQTQAGDNLSAYELHVDVGFEIEGRLVIHRFSMGEARQAIDIRLERSPTMVVFDVGGTLLATVKLELSPPLLIRQLAGGPSAIDRIAAARALGDLPEPRVVKALTKAALDDTFWGVRATAVTQLGQMAPRADALDTLLTALSASDPRVRRAAAAALGNFRGQTRAADALITRLGSGDDSVFVLGNAARALGQIRDPRAVAVLPTLFPITSFQDTVKVGALDGLGASSSEAAVDPLIAAYHPRASAAARRAALKAVAHAAEGTTHKRRVREHLEGALVDRDFTVRAAAAIALMTLRDRKAEPALEAALRRETDGRARRLIDRTLRHLRDPGTEDGALATLKGEVERLRDMVKGMQERVERLETPAVPVPPTKPPATKPPRRPRPPARREDKKPRSKPRR